MNQPLARPSAALIAACLSLLAGAARADCAGQVLSLDHGGGFAPYATLSVGGRRGQFLLDYGATASSLSRAAYPAAGERITFGDFTLPGPPGASFLLRDYGPIRAPGGQLGVVGTDLLSLRTVDFDFRTGRVAIHFGGCDAALFRRAGMTPVSQKGFFSHDLATLAPGRPNVPVLRLRLAGVDLRAQLDTGYDDAVYPHSLDVNAAAFARLKAAGLQMTETGSVRTVGCGVAENRKVWRLEQPVGLVDDAGRVVRVFPAVHLTVNGSRQCGGIAVLDEPAGMLGASFLHTLGRIVFDPWNEAVWIAAR
jgi:hypothetical protein